MGRTLTQEEKDALATQVKEFLAEECDMEVSEITDDTDIVEDLKADSLMFLELIQELQSDHEINLELRTIGKYIVKNPVKTVGEAVETMYTIIEKGEDLLKDMEE